MHRVLLGVLLLVVPALVLGCSNDGTLSKDGPLSKEEAGARYIEIVTPYNQASQDLTQAVGRTFLDLDAQQEAAKNMADASRQLIIDLTETQWPEEVAQDAEDLAASAADAQQWLRRATVAVSLEELDADLTKAAEALNETSGSAQLMRVRLDLPEIPLPAQPSNWP